MERVLLLVRDEDFSILTHAGLNLLQSKIYLTLAACDKQTIKMIAKVANVDRANVYREILNLQKMGLVKKIISCPNIFEAIPVKDGISILLQRKAEEFEKITKETKKLAKHFSADKENKVLKEESQFVMIPKKAMFIKTSISVIQNVQISNDTITSLRRFTQALPYSFRAHQIALERGVKTRVIIQKSETENFSKYLQTLMTYPNFQIRYVSEPPDAFGGCFDGKTTSVLIDHIADITESAALWTDHHSFVALFQNYFENLWNAAIPINSTASKASSQHVTINGTQ